MKQKILKKCIKRNWNFQRGGELIEKIPSVGDWYGYFLELHIYIMDYSCSPFLLFFWQMISTQVQLELGLNPGLRQTDRWADRWRRLIQISLSLQSLITTLFQHSEFILARTDILKKYIKL